MEESTNSGSRTVAHMDLDSFFVSVERLRQPKLQNIPLLIGGSSDRGVVASCSYEARKFGVHSAMPMKLARQLCPEAVIIRGDHEIYSKYSHIVTDIIAEQAPIYEKTSIDEFYLDLSGLDKFFGCYKWTTELRERIIRETGLPISFGLSSNKTVSKIATGEAKPSGQLKIDFGAEKDFMAPLHVKKIPMIGQKTQETLIQLGVQKIKTLQEMPPEMLQRVFGKAGIIMWRKANGIDPSPVEPYSEAKSISNEHTFETDTMDLDEIRRMLGAMTEKLCFKLRKQQKLCSIVSVKLRYSNFETFSRQVQLPYTAADHHVLPRVKELFDKLYERRMRIRLVGVRLSGLVHGHYQINLFDDSEERIKLYQALDKMNMRWGKTVVSKAQNLGEARKK